MKFAYKFANLLGTVYRQGDLIFTPDGNSVISPVANRITIYDLKNNKASTLPIESRFNYSALDLSPNGCILIAINEQGDAFLISLISGTVVHRYRFKGAVSAVKFSPDGKHFAVCKENNVFVFKAPGPFSGQYNAFVMERVFHGAFDETTCLDWSANSQILAVGSKDMTTKLYPLEKFKNFKIYTLGSHTASIVGCFFERNSFDLTTISANGQLCVWESSIDPTDLIPLTTTIKEKRPRRDSDSEDDFDPLRAIERTHDEMVDAMDHVKIESNEEETKLYYKRLARHYLADEVRKNNSNATLTAAAYCASTKILVTGYSTGAFFIHELPDVNLIHSLSISEQAITAIALNATGDWIALGCSGIGQLLVWEWQSETYVMKQQGHANNMSCVAYSRDGQLLATGGEDGKVKLWNIHSGFCFVTFGEHTGAVTSLCFSGIKRFVASASLDGTVRAYDLIRYRNFRTLTTPRLVQLSCVSVDSSGEFVVAGGQDVFEIFLWSMKTGRLLEVLSGHEGPISSLCFSPSTTSTTMASVSWDKTLRIWDAIERGSAHETIQLTSDALCVAFRPDGACVAVATLNAHITVFDVRTASQLASIEGRNDLGSGRSDIDLITAKKTLEARAFTTLCYSADGEFLLAGGQSKYVCIYNVNDGLILKKFEITQNRSLDGVDDFINRRKMTEFGNLALIEEREELEGGNKVLRLPGVRQGDMAARSFKPEVRVFSLEFSPSGQAWSAATTEGLLVYSLQEGLVFDPWGLQIEITPMAVTKCLQKHDYTNALVMAMKLNESRLIQNVIESVPPTDTELVLLNLGDAYIERLVSVIAQLLDTTRHVEYYLQWSQVLLTIYGQKIRAQQMMPALIALQKALTRKYEQLSTLGDFNYYTMQYIQRNGDASVKSSVAPMDKDENSEDDLQLFN